MLKNNIIFENIYNNPKKYLDLKLIPACNILWNNNIETLKVGKENNNYYLLITNLSLENTKIIKNLMNEDCRYFFDLNNNCYGFYSKKYQDLEDMAKIFKMQDTFRFKDEKTFLADYKTTGGEYVTDPITGNRTRCLNPKLINVSLDEAIKKSKILNLYVKSEGRIYQSNLFLEWHQRYLDYLNKHKS